MKQTTMQVHLEIPVNIFADMESIANANFRSMEDHIISLLCKDIEEYHEGMLEEEPTTDAIGFKVDDDDDKEKDGGDLVLKNRRRCKCHVK